MRTSRIVTVALAASLAVSPAVAYAEAAGSIPGLKFGTGPTGWVWGIFGCTGGIVFTAMAANWQQHRQLTWNEAATCGLVYWFTPPKANGNNINTVAAGSRVKF